MKVITDENCTGYAQNGHPERPGRITGTLKLLREQKELPIEWLAPEATSDDSILRAHTPEMVERLNEPDDFDGDTPYFPEIGRYARQSVGAALTALRLARNGDTVFSLMRPPGHHATRQQSMGFCYLNNVAIAALEARATGTKRLAVFDFDVHHGNGTEDILLGQPGTAFFSIHQYPAYPGTGGSNRGDNCFNYPVAPQTRRETYRDVLASAMEAMARFKPEVIGVSAGFDAYARDPLAQETLEAEDFYWIGQSLRAMQVPLFSLLEGGYSSKLPELILAYLRGVAGK